MIADNLLAHKTQTVKDFLVAHPKVQLHFAPSYWSWANQVDLWFDKIERDVMAHRVFTSVPDLKRKLMRYIRQYHKAPKAVKWKHADPSRRISTQSVGTGYQGRRAGHPSRARPEKELFDRGPCSMLCLCGWFTKSCILASAGGGRKRRHPGAEMQLRSGTAVFASQSDLYAQDIGRIEKSVWKWDYAGSTVTKSLKMRSASQRSYDSGKWDQLAAARY